MLRDLWEKIIWLIGAGEVDPVIPVEQLVSRTVIIYIIALLMIRIGKRRFMGSYTAFDILLGFIVGSILSRTITGAIRLVDMIAVIASLIALHWIIATITYYTDRFSSVIKNSPRKLIIDGEIQEDAMQKSKIGEQDLMQAVREKGKVDDVKEVKTAYLERDGNITVIPQDCKPQILEVKVEEGVQTVRIVIDQ